MTVRRDAADDLAAFATRHIPGSGAARSAEPPTTTGATPFEDLPPRRTIRRAMAASAMGNAIEWYDFGEYGGAATSMAEYAPDR